MPPSFPPVHCCNRSQGHEGGQFNRKVAEAAHLTLTVRRPKSS
jgi:hypothetical protein